MIDFDALRAVADGKVNQYIHRTLRCPGGRIVYRRGDDFVTTKIRSLHEAGLLDIPARRAQERIRVGLSDKGRQALKEMDR
jgi:hypothetical protein